MGLAPTHVGRPLIALAAGALCAPSAGAAAAVTERVSVSSSEREANGNSWGSVAVSHGGRFVVFVSNARNLVRNDTNGAADVFRRDRETGETKRVSVSSDERQGNEGSGGGVDISADGRYVVFASRATNLARRDTNEFTDVFVRDMVRGVTRRVSLTRDGRQANGPSADPVVSDDGRLVAFSSTAQLVRGDTRIEDVYIRNLVHGTTRRVSVSSRGVPGNDESFFPAISGDGRIVAFSSRATNLVGRRDRNSHNADVFVYVRAAHKTTRVSVDSDGQQLRGCRGGGSWSPVVDADASRVGFTFYGGPDCGGRVLLRDRAAGETRRVDRAQGGGLPNGWSFATGISADGNLVAFESYADNLVAGDTNGDPERFTGQDVFARDVAALTTTRVSVGGGGQQANASSAGGTVSGDGLRVVFISGATNLVAGDTNRKADVFVRGPLDR